MGDSPITQFRDAKGDAGGASPQAPGLADDQNLLVGGGDGAAIDGVLSPTLTRGLNAGEGEGDDGRNGEARGVHGSPRRSGDGRGCHRKGDGGPSPRALASSSAFNLAYVVDKNLGLPSATGVHGASLCITGERDRA